MSQQQNTLHSCQRAWNYWMRGKQNKQYIHITSVPTLSAKGNIFQVTIVNIAKFHFPSPGSANVWQTFIQRLLFACVFSGPLIH